MSVRTHPYARAALVGVGVGVLAGIVAYAIFRAFGATANWYLLGAIAIACIPGSVTLATIIEGAEQDDEGGGAPGAGMPRDRKPG